MIATCTHCQARYQLEADKVPQRVIKVRCPACSEIFSLDGTARDEPSPASELGGDFETSASPSPLGAPAEAGAINEPQASSFGDTSFEDTTPADAPDPFAAPVDAAPADEAPADEFSTVPEVEIEIPDTDLAEPAAGDPVEPVVSVASPEPAPAPGPEPVVENLTEAEPASAGVATLTEASSGSTRRRRCKEEMLARALVSDILVYNRDTRDAALAEGNLLEALGGEIKKSWELYKEKVTPEVANSTTYFREALNEILADGDSVF